MAMIREWVKRLWGTLYRRRADHELEEELRLHLELAAEDIRRRGSSGDATRAARLLVGGIDQTMEALRDRRGLPWIDDLVRDLRHAVRALQHHPGFAMTVMLTLALGIGANAAVFSIIETLLVEQLPVLRPAELVSLNRSTPTERGESFSFPEFAYLQQTAKTLGDLFGYACRTARYGERQASTDISLQLVSERYFQTLGLSAALGRTLDESADVKQSADIAVISDSFWQREFARSEHVLGQSILLGRTPYIVIGVMPRGFTGVSLDYPADAWIPLRNQPQVDGSSLLEAPDTNWVRIMTRLPSGASDRRPGAEATLLLQQSDLSTRVGAAVRGVELESAGRPDSGLRPALVTPLVLLLAIVALLLVVACVNIVHLLRAQAAARSREFFIRVAIGADRSRLIRQLLTETVLLSLLGGALGLGVAATASRALVTYLTSLPNLSFRLPDWFGFHMNLRVLAFTLGVATAVGVFTGIVPARRATTLGLESVSNASARAARRQRGQSLLVASQLGVCLLLLIVAGLFIRSFQKIGEVDLGFQASDVAQVQIDWGQSTYTDTQVRQFSKELLDEFRSMPGIVAATMSVPGIFSRSTWQTSLRLQGHTRRENVPVNVSSVAPEYFSTLRIPLVRGRDFNSRDQEHSLAVVILSETVAQGLFNGDDPIGRRVVLFDAPSPVEVIGIVKDIRLKNILAGSPKLVYVPWSQGKGPIARFTTWQIRSALPIGTVSTELERAVRHRNPEFHPTASALVDVIAESIILQRLAAWLTGLLGFLGLLLAAIGIYGLVSYLTERRTAEIGIRLALGADASQVLWRTWCDAMQPVVLGLLAGLAVATATTHVLSSYLFGITPQDPLANGLGVLTLVSVAGIACYLPSRRASRIDPWTALRHE